MTKLTWYEVISDDGLVLGAFDEFDEALKHKIDGTTIRYFDGESWILNVNRAQDENI